VWENGTDAGFHYVLDNTTALIPRAVLVKMCTLEPIQLSQSLLGRIQAAVQALEKEDDQEFMGSYLPQLVKFFGTFQ